RLTIGPRPGAALSISGAACSLSPSRNIVLSLRPLKIASRRPESSASVTDWLLMASGAVRLVLERDGRWRACEAPAAEGAAAEPRRGLLGQRKVDEGPR